MPDPLAKRRDLVLVELARRPERVDPRVPERLVGVDVPEAGDGALVEDGRLDGCAPAGEAVRRE